MQVSSSAFGVPSLLRLERAPDLQRISAGDDPDCGHSWASGAARFDVHRRARLDAYLLSALDVVEEMREVRYDRPYIARVLA